MAWKVFEMECYSYLKNNFSNLQQVMEYGKSDSTMADIAVITKKGSQFFLEIKEGNAQCCQFVVFPDEDTKSFMFSAGNKSQLTENSRKIIQVMNADFNRFSKVGTSGIPINVDKNYLYGWVHDFYTLKNVKYFITRGSDYIIFPLDRFEEYFDISACYRRKTSGSTEPNEGANYQEICTGLRKEGYHGNLEFLQIGGKSRCFFHSDEYLHTKRFLCDNYTYQLKENEYSQRVFKRKRYVYEVRRLSNTSNPNVIFQISLKKASQDIQDLQAFLAE